MARPDAILWASGRPFMGTRPQVGARPNGRQCSSGQRLSFVRPTPHFTHVSVACDARPDEAYFKKGRTPFFSAFPEISPPSLTFLWFLIQNPWSTKIQPSKLKSVFGNVILALGSTFLLIGLRYFHKLLSLEILG
jgi:hypothetical protein